MPLKFAAWLSGMLVAASATAGEPWAGWEHDYDEEKRAWKEIQAQLPAYPKAENLAPVEAGSATSHRFYVDTASVSVGEDGIVRYTAVVKSAGGANNVTFEGIRCETREQKLYAIGRNDGTWVRARDPRWQRIVLRDLKPHHYVLYREFFCPSAAHPTPARQAVDALKRGAGIAQSRTID